MASTTNKEIAGIFEDMAAVLELTGANPFRINAHVRVARVLRDLTVDVATLAADVPPIADAKPSHLRPLTDLEGVGEGSARKIVEYVQTKHVAEHDELLDEIPEGLIDLLGIPGLGPKTVKRLWEEAGVTDLASLKKAIDDGTLLKLPRMGKKTLDNLRESIAFAARAAGRVRIGDALPRAEAIVAMLDARDDVVRVAYAGSLRRGRETIGDLDILASGTDSAAIGAAFCGMDDVDKVLAQGAAKCSVRLANGMQADLRIVEDDAFGAALLYFSGSKAHNVRLRERAIKKKLRLNEYGLFPDDGDDAPPQSRGIRPVAAATEEDIYAALDLPWIPPELREDRGELTTEMPKLLEIGDIACELHAHTIASDGRLTIEQLATAAEARGFHTIAVTDHSQASAQAGGLDVKRLERHLAAVREVNAKMKGIQILAGTEVDILSDGHLDYDDDVLAACDIVVASPHVALAQDPAVATKRLLAAIENPYVDIIGHPTGRLVNRRGGLVPDLDVLVQAAVETQTVLEINANFRRLDLRDTHVRHVVDAGGLIAVNTDAHSVDDFDQLRYGVLTARRGWLTAERCVNCWPQKKLDAWRRRARG